MHLDDRYQKEIGGAPLEKVDSMATMVVGVKLFVRSSGVIEAAEASQSRRYNTKATRKNWFESFVLLCFVQVINQGGWLCDKVGWAQMAREGLLSFQRPARARGEGENRRRKSKEWRSIINDLRC